MTPTKEKMERARKTNNPFEDDIVGMAHYIRQQGKPLHLSLEVDERIFEEKRKKELEPMLRQYGEILSNYDFSPGISLNLPDIEATERIVSDYEAGKLEGIVRMELSSMDLVMCGRYNTAKD